jgi:leucyl aminopeptidase (aminopeptidase T)
MNWKKMKGGKNLALTILLILFITEQPIIASDIKNNPQKQDYMDFISVIPKIVSGFDINKGDIVLVQLWGENQDLSVSDIFALEIAKRGGVPVKWQQSREFWERYFSEVPAENLEFPEGYYDVFKPAVAVIDILMHSPAPGSGMPKEKRPYYGQYIRKLFGALSAKKYFIQVFAPTIENARDAGIDPKVFEKSLISAMDIDCPVMKRQCSILADRFSNADMVRIRTGKGKMFECKLAGRNWHKDDGTGSVPCGEIYISPIESSGQGQILVPEVYFDDKKYQNVVLSFKDGKLIETSDPEILSRIKTFPGDCDILAEFGIGLNPKVTGLVGYVPVDEKMIGTVHVAVGMNNLAGGQNDSPLHLDFVLSPESVEINGKKMMEKGKFSREIQDILQ